jgi:phosphoribosylformylglycinamidine synthase
LSDGGLAINIAESTINAKVGIGAKLDIDRKLRDDELLFGECQSVIIVTLDEDQLYELILLAQGMDVHTQTIGRVTDTGRLVINDLIDISRNEIEPVYQNTLGNILSKQ